MKSKEITEGFFKGLAKGIGYDDGSPSASNAEIDGAEIDGAGDETGQTIPGNPINDVNATLDKATQYRFPHPLFRADAVDIIVRSDGWYLNKLPKSLRGQVQRDKETRLYKVKQPANIQKFNDYYDKAADQKLVIQEPSDLL
jgi:hypothetical protein|tara:strand:+ start:2179 stop:2604 length:426 start_codon:yes stop_codon:yes gene_type:complete